MQNKIKTIKDFFLAGFIQFGNKLECAQNLKLHVTVLQNQNFTIQCAILAFSNIWN